MDISPPPSALTTLPAIVRALMAAVAAWGGRGVLSTALTMLLWRRLSGICGRMERLILRYRAGRIWTGRIATGRIATGRMGPRAVRPAVAAAAGERIWPCRFGWLVRRAAWQAAGFGCQLRAALETPEMVALLVAAPQVARILRPMCRALGVETSLLRPGAASGAVPSAAAAPAVARVSTAPAAKRKRVRVAVDFGRIPLPRGVLSAARRQGFGKVV